MKFDVDVTWNVSKIEDKVENLLDDETKIKIQQAFADIIDPWTPFLTGKLHETYEIDPESVTYLVPYASKKYYGEVYTKTVHPLATSHWDTIAMQSELPALEEKVKEILKERVRQLYG